MVSAHREWPRTVGSDARRAAAVLVLMLVLARGAAPALAAPNATPDGAYVTNGTVFALARSANTIYLGGSFSQVGPRTGPGVAMSAATGQPIAPLPQVAGGLAQVFAAVSDRAGGWFIGGGFTQVAGVARSNVAHVLAGGAVDPTWSPNANGIVRALALSGDGASLFAGGDFSGVGSIGGQTRNYIAKLSSSGAGAADPTWDPNASDSVAALALSVDGLSLFAGGSFNGGSSIGGQTRNYIAKLSTGGAGTADPTWNANANNTVAALAVSGDGASLFAGGVFSGASAIGGQARNRIAKLSTTGIGVADATWDPNANGFVDALAVSRDGASLFAGGQFNGLGSIGGQARNYIAKLSSGGAGLADATWDANANGSVFALTLSGDGASLFAGGQFSGVGSIGGQARNHMAKLSSSATGAADPTWDPNANGTVNGLAVSSDGSSLFAGGNFSSLGGQRRGNVAAIDATTGLVTPWDPNANGNVRALALSGDGSSLFAGGDFTGASSIGGQARNRIAKLSTSGTGAADPTWDPNSNNFVYALAVSRDGASLFVGGQFNGPGAIGGQARNYIAKLSSGGAGLADATWDANANGNVSALALSGDGASLFAGGNFFGPSSIGGQARNRIAKLSSGGIGAADATWDPNANNSVSALALSSDGASLFAGGFFSGAGSIGGAMRNRIAKLSSGGVGAADATWDPNANANVRALALSGDGSSLFAGGEFTGASSIGGQPRNRIAKLSSGGIGAADPTWDPNASGSVRALISAADGSLDVGGAFNTFDAAAAQGFASFGVAPAVTTQPSSQTVTAGHNASFAAAFSGAPAPTIQWQTSSDGGATFATMPGETAATLTLTSVRASQNATRYRARGSSIAGSTTSTAATLTVTTPGITPPRPQVTHATQSHTRWRRGKRRASFTRTHNKPPIGTRFSFILSQSATVSFVFTQQLGGRRIKGRCVAQTHKNRRKPACKRTVATGTLRFTAHAGANSVSFQGRLSSSNKLGLGRYTLVIIATNAAGQRSSPRSLSFTIVK